MLSAVNLERTERSSSPLWGLVLASKRWRVVKNIPFLGLFPPSFAGREGGSHSRVRETFTASVHSSSWCCSSRRSGVGSVCLAVSLQRSEITFICQKTILPLPLTQNPLCTGDLLSATGLRLYSASGSRSFDSELLLFLHCPPSTGLQSTALPSAPAKQPHWRQEEG